MDIKCDILKNTVIEHSGIAITIWPVLSLPDGFNSEYATTLQRQWAQYERAVRKYHAAGAMVNGSPNDAAVEAQQIMDSFTVMVAEMLSGTYRGNRRSRGRRSGAQRSNFRTFEAIRRVKIRVE